MYTEEKTGHSFSIAVKYGKGHTGAETGFAAFADAVLDNGCVFVQLTNGRNRTRSYYFDHVITCDKIRSKRAFAALAVATALTIGVAYAREEVFPTVLGGLLSQLVFPLAAGYTGRGKLRRFTAQKVPDVVMHFPVSAAVHRQMTKDLKAISDKDTHGIYSMPFNSCASFAVRFARSYGYKIPAGAVPTPISVARGLTALQESYGPPSPITG